MFPVVCMLVRGHCLSDPEHRTGGAGVCLRTSVVTSHPFRGATVATTHVYANRLCMNLLSRPRSRERMLRHCLRMRRAMTKEKSYPPTKMASSTMGRRGEGRKYKPPWSRYTSSSSSGGSRRDLRLTRHSTDEDS